MQCFTYASIFSDFVYKAGFQNFRRRYQKIQKKFSCPYRFSNNRFRDLILGFRVFNKNGSTIFQRGYSTQNRFPNATTTHTLLSSLKSSRATRPCARRANDRKNRLPKSLIYSGHRPNLLRGGAEQLPRLYYYPTSFVHFLNKKPLNLLQKCSSNITSATIFLEIIRLRRERFSPCKLVFFFAGLKELIVIYNRNVLLFRRNGEKKN